MIGDSSSSDLLTEYVTLLREFGLPPEDVRELHADEDASADASLRQFVAQRVDDGSREALFSRLVETLTQSRRGISATASYWNYAPEVHLDEVFEPYGCSVTFRDAVHGGDGASVEIELEDAGGTIHTMRFEYPDTPLDDDNLPALLDAVETDLLANTDLTFALLSGIDRRWRVVLLESDRLAELRRRHGDRIEFAGLPLLCEDQPPAFASRETPAVYPQAVETGVDDTDSSGASSAATDATDSTVDPADLLDDGNAAAAAAEPTADPGAVLDASPDELISDGAAGPVGSSDVGVEASDQDLKQVFGDLSDVSLEPTATDDTGRSLRPNDPPVLELGTDADGSSPGASSVDDEANGGAASETGETSDEPDAIDGLFEELERKAITGDDGAAGGGGGTAVVGSVVSTGAPTVEDPDNSGHDGSSEDPTLEELLSDADAADALAEGASADSGDASAGADREDADTDFDDGNADEGNADDGDASDEFEWLSGNELVERE